MNINKSSVKLLKHHIDGICINNQTKESITDIFKNKSAFKKDGNLVFVVTALNGANVWVRDNNVIRDSTDEEFRDINKVFYKQTK